MSYQGPPKNLASVEHRRERADASKEPPAGNPFDRMACTPTIERLEESSPAWQRARTPGFLLRTPDPSITFRGERETAENPPA